MSESNSEGIGPMVEAETAWLIEMPSPTDGAPQWFSAGRGGFNWTRDANAAIRFSRQQDAERFAEWSTTTIWGPNVRATEHRWEG